MEDNKNEYLIGAWHNTSVEIPEGSGKPILAVDKNGDFHCVDDAYDFAAWQKDCCVEDELVRWAYISDLCPNVPNLQGNRRILNIKAKQVTDWSRAYEAALATEGKEPKSEPSDAWKRRMLLCEHSPIRAVEYDVKIEGIKQWVTVHLVRHWLGFIPFVHSQRDDRRKLDCARDDLPQGSLNDMMFTANAQALINISRKRLCSCAHKETVDAWKQVRESIRLVDPVMAEKMVRECVYRGFCPERRCCGFVDTEEYKRELEAYRTV